MSVGKSGYRNWTKGLSKLTKLDRLGRFVRSESWDHRNKRLEVMCTCQKLVRWSRNYSEVQDAIDDEWWWYALRNWMGLLRHNCTDTVSSGVYGNREFPRRDCLSSRVLSWRLWEPESCQDVTVIASVGTRLVRHRVSVLWSAETQSDVCGRCTFQGITVLLLEL